MSNIYITDVNRMNESNLISTECKKRFFNVFLPIFLMASVLMSAFIFPSKLVAGETTDYVHYRLGVMYKNDKKYDQSIDEFKKVLSVYPDHYKSYMHIAEIRRKQHKLRLAILNLEKALTYNPGWGQAYKMLAEVLKEDRQYKKAIVEYQKYIGVCDPDERPAVQKKIDELVAIVEGKDPNQADIAKKSKKKVIKKVVSPKKTVAVKKKEPQYEEEFKKGVLAYKEATSGGSPEKLDEALAQFRKTLALKPGHKGAFYYAGLIRRRNGQNNMAKVNFTKALSNTGLGNNAHYYLGKIYGEEKDYETAIKHLKQYISNTDYDIGKREAESLIKRYRNILDLEKPDTIDVDIDAVGMDDLKNELSKIPPETKYGNVEIRGDSLLSMVMVDTLTDPGQAMLSGIRNFENGRLDQALDDFKKLLVKYPRGNVAGRSLYNIGVCYMRLQNYPKAENNFQQLISRFPNGTITPRAVFLKALSYLQRNELKQGEKLIRQFIQKYRNHKWVGIAYEKLGDAYISLDEPRRAIDAYSEAVSRAKSTENIVYAYFKMGDAYFSIKNPSRALESYRKAINAGEKNGVFVRVPDSYYRMADYYYKVKAYDKALPLYTKVSRKYPDHPDTPWGYFQIANIFKIKKKYNNAIEQYKALRKKFPDDYWARQAEWKLEETVWEHEYKSVLK